MQAIVYPQYGSPDVLQLQEVEKPTPQDSQVLVKVHAASANPLDWHRMRGAPFLARLDGGSANPKTPGLATTPPGGSKPWAAASRSFSLVKRCSAV